MQEHEWLASADPQAMLNHLFREENKGEESLHWSERHSRSQPLTSDRKLRLFGCASLRQVWGRLCEASRGMVEATERAVDTEGFCDTHWTAGPQWYKDVVEHMLRTFWDGGLDAQSLTAATYDLVWGDANRENSIQTVVDILVDHAISGERLASLLRGVVGNPFKPVAWWRTRKRGPGPADTTMGAEERVPLNHVAPWLTPTVCGIAQEAYQNRLEPRPCWECCGRGHYPDHYRSLGSKRSDGYCLSCRGTGKMGGGELDQQRLDVLSDALEEADCTDESVLRHLRGYVPCPINYGKGFHKSPPFSSIPEWACEKCQGEEWVKNPTPPYRGIWSLDVVLGKE